MPRRLCRSVPALQGRFPFLVREQLKIWRPSHVLSFMAGASRLAPRRARRNSLIGADRSYHHHHRDCCGVAILNACRLLRRGQSSYCLILMSKREPRGGHRKKKVAVIRLAGVLKRQQTFCRAIAVVSRIVVHGTLHDPSKDALVDRPASV
jgi:hypothetical protein